MNVKKLVMQKVIKHFIIFFICLFPLNWSFSQSGYMGKMNLGSLSTEIHPNLTKFNDRIQFVAADLNLSYERVINRKFSIALEYTKQFYRLPTKGQKTVYSLGSGYFVDSQIENDLNMSANHFTINFNKFRKSGIAPYGKFYSFQIGIVRTGISDQSLYKSNHFDGEYFYDLYEVELNESKLTLYHFGFGMMNRRAIGDKLILKYGIGFNMFIDLEDFLNQELSEISSNLLAGLTRNGFHNRTDLSDGEDLPTENQLSRRYTGYVLNGANYRISSLGLINFKLAIELPF